MDRIGACGGCVHGLSRRRFIAAGGAAVLGPALCGCRGPGAVPAAADGVPPAALPSAGPAGARRIVAAGPAATYTPTLRAAFVRRKGEYGMRWPGAVYDGEAALRRYRAAMEAEAKRLGMTLALRPDPIYTAAEADAWCAEAKAAKPDGLLLVLLDRQEHAWPTAAKAADTAIPTVVFSPVGTAFTTNTAGLAGRKGVFIASTSDFAQAAYGMKMIRAGAKLREMRYLVIQGRERKDTVLEPFGTKLRHVPAAVFLEEYSRTPDTPEIRAMAEAYVRNATRIDYATAADVTNGIKSYVVARTLLEREGADGITMDCLGALGHTTVSLPCIAWSRMLDDGLPAACEADLGACVTHALVLSLFDRPGFQQDPVPETSTDRLIGAHCSCPTRLNGLDAPPEPYRLAHHHGNRDAVPIPAWRPGQRVTVADLILGKEGPELIVSTGTAVENIAVPPAGGCVVSVAVALDTVKDSRALLAYPGFHQLFFYGDCKKELVAYCHLFGIRPVVV